MSAVICCYKYSYNNSQAIVVTQAIVAAMIAVIGGSDGGILRKDGKGRKICTFTQV